MNRRDVLTLTGAAAVVALVPAAGVEANWKWVGTGKAVDSQHGKGKAKRRGKLHAQRRNCWGERGAGVGAIWC